MVDVLNRCLVIFTFLVFICPESYKMDVLSAHPCSPNPCKNSGVCHIDDEDEHDFHCACPLGYRAKVCSETVKHCDALTCQDRRDCISSPKGAICICVGSISGRFCHLDLHSPNPWDQIEYIFSSESQHQVEAFLGAVVAVTLVISLCLTIHCCRVGKKRKTILKEYKKQLEDGKVPKDLPPDWFDVSSALCKHTLCCKKETSQEKEGRQKKSDTNLRSTSKSKIEDLSEREDAFNRLMNDRSDLNIIKNRASKRLKRHAPSVSSRRIVAKNRTNHSKPTHYDMDSELSDSYVMSIHGDNSNIVDESLDEYEQEGELWEQIGAIYEQEGDLYAHEDLLRDKYIDGDLKYMYTHPSVYRKGLLMESSEENGTDEECNETSLEYLQGRNLKHKRDNTEYQQGRKEENNRAPVHNDIYTYMEEKHNDISTSTDEDIPLLPCKPSEKTRKYRAYSYIEQPHFIEISCNEASEKDFCSHNRRISDFRYQKKAPSRSYPKKCERANLSYSTSGKYRRFMLSKAAYSASAENPCVTKTHKPRNSWKGKLVFNRRIRSACETKSNANPLLQTENDFCNNDLYIPGLSTKRGNRTRANKSQNCSTNHYSIQENSDKCIYDAFGGNFYVQRRNNSFDGENDVKLYQKNISNENDLRHCEPVFKEAVGEFLDEPIKTLCVEDESLTIKNEELPMASPSRTPLTFKSENNGFDSEHLEDTCITENSDLLTKEEQRGKPSLKDISDNCKNWLEQTEALLSDLSYRYPTPYTASQKHWGEKIPSTNKPSPLNSRTRVRERDCDRKGTSAIITSTLNSPSTITESTCSDEGDFTVVASDTSSTDCSTVTLIPHMNTD